MLGQTDQLSFLKGSAGTENKFMVKALIGKLASGGKKCLIVETTAIAAVEYLGGITLHSLFKLGIDDATKGDFRSNSEHHIIQANHILSADLAVTDEVSILTPWAAYR
jgi:hypothetical protein